jgi:hypothetical protein
MFVLEGFGETLGTLWVWVPDLPEFSLSPG